jgi:hypothetical protein
VRLNCLKVGIERRSAAKQNSFNCRTWNGLAVGVSGGAGDVRRESSGVSPGEGQCLQAEHNRISSKALDQCEPRERQGVVNQWNRESRTENCVQSVSAELVVQEWGIASRKKKLGLGSVGVDGGFLDWRWLARSLAGFPCAQNCSV